jgi:4-hydroxybenzoate polyprenyltransferase
MKYLRLIRLQDQYIQLSSALFAGIFIKDKSWMILIWAVAVTFLSFSAFIVNEVVDRRDTDRTSWNPEHSHFRDILDPRIVSVLFWACTTGGIILSSISGHLWWGMAIWAIGVMYSFPQIRFKGRFGFDCLAQLLVWWGLPFLAPVWGRIDKNILIAFVVITSMIIWSAFYPYQIADYKADKKTGLHATHVELGVKGSVWFGFLLGIIGVLLFFFFHLWTMVLWVILIFVFTPITLWNYGKWLRTDDNKILRGMQEYIAWVKPIGNIFPFYLFLIWRVFS